MSCDVCVSEIMYVSDLYVAEINEDLKYLEDGYRGEDDRKRDPENYNNTVSVREIMLSLKFCMFCVSYTWYMLCCLCRVCVCKCVCVVLVSAGQEVPE